MKSIKSILLELVAVQSDTGTALERDIAAVIYSMITEDGYFKAHPNQHGAYIGHDPLERPVIWALRKGTTSKTIILMGHYDAVEIESYGQLKPYALEPRRLKEALKEMTFSSSSLVKDLEDERWLFGRGTADMKAGIAINLHTLLTPQREDINLLFMAVPDEENLSSGALNSLPIYETLKRQFQLDYQLALVTEPQIRGGEPGKSYQLVGGSMGKMLPVVLVKGVLTHAADLFNGLNPSLIFSEILRRVELSTDFVSEDRGVFTQPPTAQGYRDQKNTYDVSVPEYAAAFFNVLFLKSKMPSEILKDLKRLCQEAAQTGIDKYHQSFSQMAEKGFLREEDRKHFQPRIMTLFELEKEASAKEGFAAFQEALEESMRQQIARKEINLPNASIEYMKAILNFYRIDEPVVVIGVAPPYYPAVTNEALSENLRSALDSAIAYADQAQGATVEESAYLSGMCDLSYLSCQDPEGERRFLHDLILPKALYDVPVEQMAKLNVPAFLLGPMARDVHQIGERVYLPDVTETIPVMIRKIIEHL
jgi:arginine utilization protein RocB